MRSSFRLARRRTLAFLLDWLSWVYLFYGGFSLHYLYTSPTLIWRPEEKFVLPPLDAMGWVIAVLVTLELAVLCRTWGISIGLRATGLAARGRLDAEPEAGGRDQGARLGFSQRALWFLAGQLDLVAWGGALGLSLWAGATVGQQVTGVWGGVAGVAAAGGLFYLLALVSSGWLSRGRTLPEALSGIALLPKGKEASRRRTWYLSGYGVMGLALLGLSAVLGWQVTDIQLGVLIRDVGKPIRLWRGLANPDFSYLLVTHPLEVESILAALVKSLFMALLATVLGAMVSFPLAFLGARNITAGGRAGRIMYAVTRGFFNVFRSIESIFWASIFAIWVGFGPFAGTIALFLHTIAALGKLYSEQVEHIDPGPVEAAIAAGGNRLQAIRQAVIPQIIPPFLAFTLYRWDINLRMATVVGFVGGGGIGLLLRNFKEGLEWTQVGAVVVCFAVTVWLLDFVSGWVRERIV